MPLRAVSLELVGPLVCSGPVDCTKGPEPDREKKRSKSEEPFGGKKVEKNERVVRLFFFAL
jgi:hypothetical protein